MSISVENRAERKREALTLGVEGCGEGLKMYERVKYMSGLQIPRKARRPRMGGKKSIERK